MNDDRVKSLLREALPRTDDAELKRDLWPQMLRRIDEQTIRVSPFDWLLVAAVVASIAIFPQFALALLYHL